MDCMCNDASVACLFKVQFCLFHFAYVVTDAPFSVFLFPFVAYET
jgi:hypothetical protein